jgi:hypothetical protein
MSLCNDKRAVGEVCPYNGICASGYCHKTGDGEVIQIEVEVEMGTCGCLAASDCTSGTCNTDTHECTGLAPAGICEDCDVDANNCTNGATCVPNTSGLYPKCIK